MLRTPGRGLATFGLNTCIFLASLVGMAQAGAAEPGGEHHKNHVAVVGGMAWHDSKNSEFIGVDYIRYATPEWGFGGFYEEVDGDFDLQVMGVLISRDFGNGWRFNFGPGLEYKLEKHKTLFLFRFQGSYSWHVGHWSFSPVVTVDWIEDDNETYYAGFSVGYGW